MALQQSQSLDKLLSPRSGRSAVWLAHLVWDQGVGGSNPSAPTFHIQNPVASTTAGFFRAATPILPGPEKGANPSPSQAESDSATSARLAPRPPLGNTHWQASTAKNWAWNPHSVCDKDPKQIELRPASPFSVPKVL